MAVNDFTVSQSSSVLNALVKQATGQTVLASSTPGDFTSVAQTALKNGYDPVFNAISQLWSNTIFRTPVYTRKFRGLEMSAPAWGNAQRKISPVSTDVHNDQGSDYPVFYNSGKSPATGDGKSVDQYAIRKPQMVQTNFYGQSVWQETLTVFKRQLAVALSGPDELMRFNAMNLQEISNKREQYRETMARGLLINMLGSLIDENQAGRVVHLLTEYNAKTGLKLTAQTVMQPTNYAAFIRWVYARMQTIAQLMAERSQIFQTVLAGKPILRNTAAGQLKCYISAQAKNEISAMALSDTYHDNLLRFADYEGVTYWQSIGSPDSIQCTPTYTDTNGTIKTGEAVTKAGIFGVMFDEQALGYGIVDAEASNTPYNSKGRYWNMNWYEAYKTIFDMTEKAVILLLD